MADEGVYIRLGADASELQAALGTGTRSFADLKSAVASGDDSFQRFAGTADGLRKQFSDQAAAIGEVNRQLKAGWITLSEGEEAVGRITAAFKHVGNEGAAGAGRLSLATAGARRELIVLGHEAISGNFSRIPGSLMVLAERMGGVSPATKGTVGAFAALGLGAYELISHLAAANSEITAIRMNMAALGRGGEASTAELKGMVADLKETFWISSEAARAAVAEVEKIPRATKQTRQSILDLGTAWAESLGKTDAKEMVEVVGQLAKTVSGGTEAMRSFGLAHNLLSVDQLRAIDDAKKENDELKAQEVFVTAVTARFGPYIQALEKYHRAASAAYGTMDYDPNAKAPKLTDYADQAPDQGKVQEYEQHRKLMESTKGLADLEEKRADLNRRIAEMKAEQAKSSGADAQLLAGRIATAEAQLADLGKPKGDASQMQVWRAQLEDMHAASDAGRAEELKGDISFWEAKKQLVRQGSRDAVEIEKQIARDRIALKKEEEREEEQADKERQERARVVADGDLQIARITLAAKKDALDEEVAAGRMSAEERIQQIRTLQESVFRSEDSILSKELATLDQGDSAWERTYQKRRILAEQHKADMAKLSADEVKAEQKAAQDSAAAWERMLSPIERAVDTSIQGLVMGTQTRQQALARMAQSVVAEEIAADTKWLGHKLITNAVGLQADKSAAQGGMLAWLLSEHTKTTTTAASEAARTAATRSGAAARDAADASGSVGFFGRIGQMLADWLGLETGKTGATVAGSAARDTADGTAAAASIMAAKIQAAGTIPAYAAIAGAAAMSSVACIPFVGWAMAPEVGGETYADAMLYLPMASAAGGMERVPYDGMLIEAHKDESILPASFANPLRNFIHAMPALGLPGGMAPAANSNSGSVGTAPAQTASTAAPSGGVTIVNNIQAVDPAGVANLFQRSGSALVTALNRQIGLGAKIGGIGR